MTLQNNHKTKWQRIPGKVTKGYGVASGQTKDSPYPQGSIVMQTPFFLERGLDIRHYYPATLNVSIAPNRFRMVNPEWTFQDVAWFEECCETFSFSRCRILYSSKEIDGLIYYPHPETKPDHFQDDSVLEILAPFLEDLGEGERIIVLLKKNEVEIF